MQYLLIAIQHGKGCDYTIGCGIMMRALKAKTATHAMREIRELMWNDEEGYRYKDDGRFAEAYLVEIVTPIDVDEIYDEAEENEWRAAEIDQERRERQEYERLKKKFGE